jgi:DNA-binding CsgD family transcriptional regulator
VATAAPLVGRGGELGRLHEMLAGAVAGRGASVRIEGEAGIGKSALIDAVVAEAQESACRVLRGTATEIGQRFALQVVNECVRGLTWSAAAVGTEVPADPVTAAGEQIVALVEGLAARSPVLLVLDDAQWADPASLQVWGRLAGECRTLPLLMVLASWPAAGRAELAALTAAPAADGDPVIRLGPLGEADVVELLGRALGADPPAAAVRLALDSGGNPLYVQELARGFAHHSRGDGDPAGGQTPGSLRELIAERLQHLSGDTRRVLCIAALLGPAFSRADLAVAAGGAADPAAAVREAVASQVLVAVDEEQLAFRHGLIRQALVDSVPHGLAAALRLEAAQALHAAGAGAQRVASLLVQTGDEGAAVRWLREWLPGAVPHLLYVAPEVTGELAARALRGAPVSMPGWEELRAWQVVALSLRGRDDEMERLGRPLLAVARGGPLVGQVAWLLANSLTRTERPAQAREVIAQALADERTDPGWAARLRSLRALIAVLFSPAEAEEEAAGAVAAAERSGDSYALAYALHALALMRMRADRNGQALRVLDRALAAIGDHPSSVDLALLLISNRSATLANLGRTGEALTQVRTGLLLAGERGAVARADPLRVTAAELCVFAGLWDDALAELDTMDPGRQSTSRGLRAAGLRVLVAVHRDQPAAAGQALAALPPVEPWTRELTTNSGYLNLALADRAEARGEPALAWAEYRRLPGADWPAAAGACNLPWLIRHALAAGDHAAANLLAEMAEATDGSPGAEPVPPLRRANAHYYRAVLDRDPQAAEAGADLNRHIDHRLLVAVFLEEAALLRAEHGDLAKAREHLREALAIYAELGAGWDTRRAAARLRPYGVRTGQRGPRSRPATGWQALTLTEQRVATMAADGRTNSEIAAVLLLSRRTVETHISHVLAKLGGQSRVDIAREAAKLAFAPGEQTAAPRRAGRTTGRR